MPGGVQIGRMRLSLEPDSPLPGSDDVAGVGMWGRLWESNPRPSHYE